jgi:hypothetical protein
MLITVMGLFVGAEEVVMTGVVVSSLVLAQFVMPPCAKESELEISSEFSIGRIDRSCNVAAVEVVS